MGEQNMVKEGLKKILPVMQAFVEGKTIQRYDDKKDDWYDISPNANINFCYDYRIKPEPKYRPFKNQEECWQEMHKHPDFGWIKGKVTGEYKQVIRVFGCKTELIFNISYNSPADYSPEMMFDSYTFTDGTPFGIKDE